MARDGVIDLSYVLTAQMIADGFKKQLTKLRFLKQCAGMVTIGIGARNSLCHGSGYPLGNGLGNGLRNGLGIGRCMR
jgi:hypothetical protein